MREPDGPLEDRSNRCGAGGWDAPPHGAWAVGEVCGTASVRALVCAAVLRTSESVSEGSRLRPRRLLAGRVLNPELPDMSASAERVGVGGEKPVLVEAIVGGCVQVGAVAVCAEPVGLALP